jgi:ribosome modulation factor
MTPFEEGRQAYMEYRGLGVCPYETLEECVEWVDGWFTELERKSNDD